MDALQLLTLSLSGRCAFSVLTLVVPHLPPPGSFAILLMADTGSLSPHSALLMHQRMWIAYFFCRNPLWARMQGEKGDGAGVLYNYLNVMTMIER